MVKPTEIIAHQGFGKWFCKIVSGLCLSHLHNIVGNMLPNKMVAKCHGFLVQGATRIFRGKNHTHVVHK